VAAAANPAVAINKIPLDPRRPRAFDRLAKRETNFLRHSTAPGPGHYEPL